jgi:hypothetical protein
MTSIVFVGTDQRPSPLLQPAELEMSRVFNLPLLFIFKQREFDTVLALPAARKNINLRHRVTFPQETGHFKTIGRSLLRIALTFC